MSPIRHKKKLSFIYELVMITLAVIAVTLTISDFNNQVVLEPSSYLYWVDFGILIVFAVDYFVRLILSSDKKQFFKSNIFDLIAIIPFSSMFRIFRAFRIFRFLRVKRIFRMARLVKGVALLGKIKRRLNAFIHTNGFIYAIYITIATLIIGTISIHFFEFSRLGRSLGDAFWWSFVTASTGGDANMPAETVPGRIVAVVLMFVGIGFVGMLTGTIATYFLDAKNFEDDDIEDNTIVDISDLEDEEIKQVLDYIEFMRNRS